MATAGMGGLSLKIQKSPARGWARGARRGEIPDDRTHYALPILRPFCHYQQGHQAVNWSPRPRTQAPHYGWTGGGAGRAGAESQPLTSGLALVLVYVTVHEPLPLSVKQGQQLAQWFSTRGHFTPSRASDGVWRRF